MTEITDAALPRMTVSLAQLQKHCIFLLFSSVQSYL